MIYMPTLEQAREEARMLIARDGGYWLDQLPPQRVKLEFIEKVETE